MASADAQYREAWRGWQDFLDTAPLWLKLVLNNANPEVALSLPDLLDLAVVTQDEHTVSIAVRRLREEGIDIHHEVEKYFGSGERESLGMARRARVRLADALHWYFVLQHHRDRDAGSDSREYLRRHLARLASGDAVLTTNWDPLIERTLAEDGRWSPAEGYGFHRELVELAGDEKRPLPSDWSRPTEIQLLKLHGCFGWRDLDGRFFLDGVDYLDIFGFKCHGRPIQIRDASEPESYSPSDPVVAFPSFLKSLAHEKLAEVWRQASRLICECSEFVVGGYSLPASDSAVRALLLPIANAVRAGRIVATVVDPANATLDRWRQFLGPSATLLRGKFETTSATLWT